MRYRRRNYLLIHPDRQSKKTHSAQNSADPACELALPPLLPGHWLAGWPCSARGGPAITTGAGWLTESINNDTLSPSYISVDSQPFPLYTCPSSRSPSSSAHHSTPFNHLPYPPPDQHHINNRDHNHNHARNQNQKEIKGQRPGNERKERKERKKKRKEKKRKGRERKGKEGKKGHA